MVLRPGGFPEYSPAEQLVFDNIKKIIEANYSQYGFAHIETPAVESTHVLLAKNGEDAGKQIFGLYGLAQGNEDTKDYALHFDLTVPFARYILDRENDITFPFKRYQIQPVRRGERSQRGRFKEFRQSDIDVIWQETEKGTLGKNLYYDAEMLVVIAKTLHEIVAKFLSNKPFTLHVNNRYLLAGFFSQFEEKVVPQLYNLLDKYYKMGFEIFQKELAELVSPAEVKKIISFVQCNFDRLDPNLVDNDNYRRGYQELQEVLRFVDGLNQEKKYNIVWDPYIIRGLDYYTGTVYETLFDDDIALGSISSGGRYENLTGYINPKKSNYSGVGGSIGLSRMVYLILETMKPEHTTQTEYLFVHFPETIQDILMLANLFINEGKTIEVYPSAEKLGKQFTYADKKGIPHVVIFGQGEKDLKRYKIKNMKTGEEQEVTL
ncbi:MAG: histidine--tRNA ligase [candidate division SR1 bacterium]|nr:histidine--tRNA ligase [candidate division SR1 bacterium]